MTHVERLAAFFRTRSLTWIDGRELAAIAGAYAWRTRTSELRKAPFRMRIENRQRRVRGDTRTVVVSEYRYVPDPPAPHRDAADPSQRRMF